MACSWWHYTALREQVYAITTERRISHPATQAIRRRPARR
jgi:hypothetical protein